MNTELPKTMQYINSLEEKEKRYKLTKLNTAIMYHKIHLNQLWGKVLDQTDEELLKIVKE